MRTKILVALIASTLWCTWAQAQNPTAVTGTILDPNSVPYYPAQVTACLTPTTLDPTVGGKHVNNNIGSNYCVGSVPTAPDGSFSMSLFANGNIVPGATQWLFTVQTVGAAPPAGKGSQSFTTSAVTISGSSQSVTSSFTGLPALLNSSSSGSASSQVVIDATSSAFGMKWDAQEVHDATFSIGTGNVVSNNATFKASDVGKIAYGYTTCATSGITVGETLNIAQGTIDVFTDAHHVHVTTNAAANATNACFKWGSNDDAGLLAVEAAALAAPQCPRILMPPAEAFIDVGHFIQALPSCTVTEGGIGGSLDGWGQVIQGWGKGVTTLHILPNPTMSKCTGGVSGIDCFGGQQGQLFKDFTITGGGQSRTGVCDNKNAWEMASYSRLEGVAFYNWGTSETTHTCLPFLLTGIGTVHVDHSEIDGFSTKVTTSAAGAFYFNQSAIQDICQQRMVEVNTTGFNGGFYSTQTEYLGGASTCSPTNQSWILNFGNFYSTQDLYAVQNTNRQLAINNQVAGARAYVDMGNFITTNAAGGVPLVNSNAAAQIHIGRSRLQTGTGDPWASLGLVFDDCGNVVTGGVAATSTVISSCSNLTAAPTISSGFGTSPSIVNNSGPLSFSVNVGTGGTATSGVIGLPAAPTGWTCSASDITTQSSTVFLTKQIASATNSATLANFNTAGAQAAWAASDILTVSCAPR